MHSEHDVCNHRWWRIEQRYSYKSWHCCFAEAEARKGPKITETEGRGFQATEEGRQNSFSEKALHERLHCSAAYRSVEVMYAGLGAFKD